MPLIVENPQHRKRGTASRHNRSARYQQPNVNEWRALNDNNEANHEEQSVETEEIDGVTTKPPKSPSAFRSRRRRKRKGISVGDNDDFCFNSAPDEADSTAKKSAHPSRDSVKNSTKGNGGGGGGDDDGASKEKIQNDTPMPPPNGQDAAKKHHVSPEDEVPKPLAPETPAKDTSEVRPGSHVLEGEYSGKWKTSSDSVAKLSIARGSNLESNDEVDRLTSKHAAESPRPYVNDNSRACDSGRAAGVSEAEPATAPKARTLAQAVQNRANDRSPIIFSSDSPVEPSPGVASAPEVELSRALREKDEKISKLQVELEQSKKLAQEYRKLSSDSTSAMQQAVNERHTLEQLADRQRSGFEAVLHDRERALENLRNRNLVLEQHARTSVNADEMRDAQERIQNLEAELALANGKLESAKGLISILQQENRIGETRIHAAEENASALETRQDTYEETMQRLQQERESESANQSKELEQLRTELANEAKLRKKAESTVESLRQESLRWKQSTVESQSIALEALKATHDESMRQLEEQHETVLSNQAIQLKEHETKLSNEAELRKTAESTICGLQSELSRLRQSMESQGKLHQDSQQAQSSQIGRLETLVRDYEESQQQLMERCEELQSTIQAQRTSFEAELSANEAAHRKEKAELSRRVEELEENLTRQRQQAGEPMRAPSPREAMASAGNSQRTSSQSSSSSSRVPPRSATKPSPSSRRRQATALVIPGQSLSQAGVLPGSVSSFVRPSSQASTDSQRSMGRKPRVVFGDPHDQSSDSDSD